jgi:virginiamycin B lyase
MTIAATPTTGTYPYGIQINSKGVPWYVDFRGNRIGSINPETTEITEYELPHPDARPRRIAITPDDAVWYTDYARGYLGRFVPETRKVQEWISPDYVLYIDSIHSRPDLNKERVVDELSTYS